MSAHTPHTIDIDCAAELLDFGRRIQSPQRAREQLEGAVAIHNMLAQHGVAYLADEVGMGKTLVALGVVALFRHFDAGFRVLFITPRENIQIKWAKEMRAFVAHNVRFADLRVRGLGGAPARPLVHCGNLLSLLRESALDPDRDFFTRLSSFSLPLGRDEDSEGWFRLRDTLRGQLPWLDDAALALRGKKERKDSFARALACALPPFDLVVLDEAHNLKHGFREDSAARNRVLALAMGHPSGGADRRMFPTYGPRARRVLFLSATPIEESYGQLWNQLDVFGRGDPYRDLLRSDLDEAGKKRLAASFLVRRVTALRVGEGQLTKNQYRREWRGGGVTRFDDPVRLDDDRQRLTVALVQKKVTEVLGSERFGNRFQIGMLASFESFLETAKLKRGDDEASNFDGAGEVDAAEEREGIDVRDINLLARSHFETFGREMPHPKMDALVARLRSSWDAGRKALVFVRRVASVKELKAKLDETHDEWLIARLEAELPATLQARLADLVRRYRSEKRAARERGEPDGAGADSFFAWFFRGEGPRGVVSGANIQRRFIQAGAVLSTFFEQNHVAELLGARPGSVLQTMAGLLGRIETDLADEIRRRGARFLGRARRIPRKHRFEAAEAAAMEILHEAPGPWQPAARVAWELRFQALHRPGTAEPPANLASYLETRTFFTELHDRPEVLAALWPAPADPDLAAAFREREIRAQLLARAARLGHAFIDFYILQMQRLGSFDLRTTDEDADDAEQGSAIAAYLDLLDAQRLSPGPWRAFHELEAASSHVDLILDVNLPDARTAPLAAIPALLGDLLGEQQPVGGMFGQVSQTLVRQFRMPGYPLVLVSTDLLQEGEDLHTFCSDVYHYGISWTPSAMEQRVGRIDRVRSQTERRLSSSSTGTGTGAAAPPAVNDDELLQVYLPHLADTVESLQVRRVLERMNTFLRLMHEGLAPGARDDRHLDVQREIVTALAPVERITERLHSAFPAPDWALRGKRTRLAATPDVSAAALARFAALHGLDAGLPITWEPNPDPPTGVILATASLPTRLQPFALYLRTVGDHLVVRCVVTSRRVPS
jgi:hypothetical protein